MKIVILEGCDNLGKTTLIKGLYEYYIDKYNVLIMHSTSPKPNYTIDLLDYQRINFINDCYYLKAIEDWYVSTKNSCKETLVILDRWVQGEYVWGHIYRKYSINEINERCVKPTTTFLKSFIKENDIVNILLDASEDFIISHDDGLSMCSNDDLENQRLKINKQRGIFYLTSVKPEYNCFKNYLVYDVSEKHSINFKDKNIISNDIIKYINNVFK